MEAVVPSLTREQICAAIVAPENRGAWQRSVRWAHGDEGAAWQGLYYVASLWVPGGGSRLFSWLYTYGPPNARKAALGARTSRQLRNAKEVRFVSVSRVPDPKGGEVDLLPELAIAPSEAPDFDPDEVDEARAAMATLDERTRTALELRYLEGLTLDRVGQRVGVTHEGARQIIERGLRLTRERIERRRKLGA